MEQREGGDIFWRQFALRACQYADSHQKKFEYLKQYVRKLPSFDYLYKVCETCEVFMCRMELNQSRDAMNCEECGETLGK